MKSLSRIHFIILAASAVLTVVSMIMIAEPFRPIVILREISFLFQLTAIISGFIYLFRDYQKQAAIWYKVFISSMAISMITGMIRDIFYTPGKYGPGGVLAFIICTRIISIVILLLLALKRNMGEKKTWTVYGILLVLEVVANTTVFIFGISAYMNVLQSSNYLIPIIVRPASRLLLIGTLGLAIRGKYMDKNERGR